ncbi:unnamed protein product [Ostreobium quekettii]|uniref:Uncharacterized protein n=1 Tax=Ostreobium quekettii TaxID=121088 RepID=A0A8S1J5I9_9CHLO|nr:unnamed protein product [Ostreobium quekettii]
MPTHALSTVTGGCASVLMTNALLRVAVVSSVLVGSWGSFSSAARGHVHSRSKWCCPLDGLLEHLWDSHARAVVNMVIQLAMVITFMVCSATAFQAELVSRAPFSPGASQGNRKPHVVPIALLDGKRLFPFLQH